MAEETRVTGSSEPVSQYSETGKSKKRIGKRFGQISAYLSEKGKKIKSSIEKKISSAEVHISQGWEHISERKALPKKVEEARASEMTRKSQRVGVRVFPQREAVERGGSPPPRRPAPPLPSPKIPDTMTRDETAKGAQEVAQFRQRILEAQKAADPEVRERACHSIILEFKELCKKYPTEVNRLLQCFDDVYTLLGARDVKDLTEVVALDQGLKAILPHPFEDPTKIWDALVVRYPHLSSLLKSIRISVVRQRIVDCSGEWAGAVTATNLAPAGELKKQARAKEGKLRQELLDACTMAEGLFTGKEKDMINILISNVRKRIEEQNKVVR